MRKLLLLALSVVLFSACGAKDTYDQAAGFFQDPDVEPVKTTLRTTIPLAYAASVAMSAVNGTAPSNVIASNTCSSYPCGALVDIDVSTTDLPIAMPAGHMLVAGWWTSANSAILTVTFKDTYGGSSLFRVHDVSVFPVNRTASGVNIVYADADVNVSTGPTDPNTLDASGVAAAQAKAGKYNFSDDASANVALNAWVVKVDQNGTPNNYGDDRYTVAGGGESLGAGAGSASVMQVAMAKTVMTPACRLNPMEGGAVINEIDASSGNLPVVATAALTFNSGCSGNTRVFAATGNYMLAIGDNIPLSLATP